MQGVAVALRLSDLLLFNPKAMHCVSSRTLLAYDVFCMLFYLKTAVVGGNDNSRPLKCTEQVVVDE